MWSDSLAWVSDLELVEGGIHTRSADRVRLSEPKCSEEGIRAGKGQ